MLWASHSPSRLMQSLQPPALQLLSKGTHHVQVMATGHDAGCCKALAVTPWSNVPVGNPHMEALYIRDDASGRLWSPRLLPTRIAGRYTTDHGFGYNVFEHTQGAFDSDLWAFIRAQQ